LFGRIRSRLADFLSDLDFLTELRTGDRNTLVDSDVGDLVDRLLVSRTADLN
jgi:hypothetical protein